MPNRILKESICTSDEIDVLSPEAEAVFYRLLVNADDYGRFDARIRVLMARLFPLRVGQIKEIQMESWLKELVDAALVTVYSVDDRQFLQIITWTKHQQVRNQRSKFPAPEEAEGPQPVLRTLAAVETERPLLLPAGQTESENEPRPAKKEDTVPYAQIIEAWNSLCPSLPKVEHITSGRRAVIAARWREWKKLDQFKDLFRRVEASDFCSGRSGKFRASFDWVLKPANLVKILEGNYASVGGADGKFGKSTAQEHFPTPEELRASYKDRQQPKASGASQPVLPVG